MGIYKERRYCNNIVIKKEISCLMGARLLPLIGGALIN